MTSYTVIMYFKNGRKTHNIFWNKQSLDRFIQYSYSLNGDNIINYNVIPMTTTDIL